MNNLPCDKRRGLNILATDYVLESSSSNQGLTHENLPRAFDQESSQIGTTKPLSVGDDQSSGQHLP
ncbi:hypothetical protein N7474_002867 [Penicillium riverlandense]|uniref:uncharacterized protein n=1 Tax=Penicillium riverlandense TaxID=1903569 RepID=UPI00254678A7|nr:uncharacterized protein N7474_002867 [Penicillium riverlandense]KAJ5825729.1 hypothetical protein N7474_002867 [Penicillium riverlandense]